MTTGGIEDRRKSRTIGGRCGMACAERRFADAGGPAGCLAAGVDRRAACAGPPMLCGTLATPMLGSAAG